MGYSYREYRTIEEEVRKDLRRTAAVWQHKYTATQNNNGMSFYFLLKAEEAAHRGRRRWRGEINAAPWKRCGMMDDARRSKRHINPPAQRDYPKVAAAVSPSPPVRASRDKADDGEEDTLVIEPGRAGASASPGNRVKRGGEHWSERWRRDEWAARPAGEGIKDLMESAARKDRLMAVL